MVALSLHFDDIELLYGWFEWSTNYTLYNDHVQRLQIIPVILPWHLATVLFSLHSMSILTLCLARSVPLTVSLATFLGVVMAAIKFVHGTYIPPIPTPIGYPKPSKAEEQ